MANSAVVAGIAIGFAGAPLASAIDALSSLASAISLSFLKLPVATLARAGDSMLVQLRAGFGELRDRPWVALTAGYLVGPLAGRYAIEAIFNVAALGIVVATVVPASVPEVWSLGRMPGAHETSA